MKQIFWLLMAMSWMPMVRAQSVIRVSAPQVKDDVLAGTEKFERGAKNTTEINLDPRMMGLIGNSNGDMGDLAHKMDFVVVRTYEYEQPGMYKQEDVDAIQARLKDGSWNCFVHVRESKSSEATDICGRTAADRQTNELIIISAEKKELTFVHLKGRMTLSDLQKMSMLQGIGGMGEASQKMIAAPPPPPPPHAPRPPSTANPPIPKPPAPPPQ